MRMRHASLLNNLNGLESETERETEQKKNSHRKRERERQTETKRELRESGREDSRLVSPNQFLYKSKEAEQFFGRMTSDIQ